MEQIFKYNGSDVAFDLTPSTVMVNATEMAKIFGRKVNHFLENESTKAFLEACLKSRNSGFLGVQNKGDLVVSKQKSGTWMHRVLALKFAAWLNPDFELWVYYTIDQLLFGAQAARLSTLKEQTAIDREIRQLRDEIEQHPLVKKLEALKKKRSDATKGLRKLDREIILQLDIFSDDVAVHEGKDNLDELN